MKKIYKNQNIFNIISQHRGIFYKSTTHTDTHKVNNDHQTYGKKRGQSLQMTFFILHISKDLKPQIVLGKIQSILLVVIGMGATFGESNLTTYTKTPINVEFLKLPVLIPGVYPHPIITQVSMRIFIAGISIHIQIEKHTKILTLIKHYPYR